MSREDSGVIDLFAICARASATPAGDLRPPDLRSVAPPATTSDLGDDAEGHGLGALFARRSRKLVALGAGGIVALAIGLAIASTSGGTEPVKATAALQLPPVTVAPPPSPVIEAPAAAPVKVANAIPLPPPPTTGAPVMAKAPPRAVSPAVAMRGRAPAPSGPKMMKVQSGGVASR